MPILRTEDLKVYFGRGEHLVKALDGVDIFLAGGVTTALAGESGCGKTTLARTILRLHQPQAGRIYLEDKDITLKVNEPFLRRNVQIVFQNPSLSVDPRYTVFATLYEALTVFKPVDKRQARDIIAETLRDVELDPALMNRYPHELSGGQLQRVCIGRALINKPRLIILDEAVSSLDITTASRIIRLLAKLQQEWGLTFLFVSHNLKLLRKNSSFCFIMYQGKIVEYGARDSVYQRPAHPYTKLLLEAAGQKLKTIPASPQTASQGGPADKGQEEGCPFQGRCRKRISDCQLPPAKKEVGPGHFAFCHRIK